MKLTQRSLKEVFDCDIMPVLIYANRQNAQEGKRVRPMHSHQGLCELLICFHGSGIYNIDHESYEIHKGDLIFYNAGSYHEVLSSGSQEIGTYCFGFSDVHRKGLPENHLTEKGSAFVRPSGVNEEFLLQLADQILAADNRSPAEQLRIQLMAVAFLLTACRVPSENLRSLTRKSSETAVAAKEYIDAHFAEQLKLDDIAGHLSCSTSYLSHSFKELTGYAPLQYILRSRIGQAETLLISSDLSISYISSVTGFESPSYFHRMFRKIVGTTPALYRKKYLEELHGSRKQM